MCDWSVRHLRCSSGELSQSPSFSIYLLLSFFLSVCLCRCVLNQWQTIFAVACPIDRLFLKDRSSGRLRIDRLFVVIDHWATDSKQVAIATISAAIERQRADALNAPSRRRRNRNTMPRASEVTQLKRKKEGKKKQSWQRIDWLAQKEGKKRDTGETWRIEDNNSQLIQHWNRKPDSWPFLGTRV